VYDVPGPPDPAFDEAYTEYQEDKNSLPLKQPKCIELGEDVNLRIAFNSNCKEAYFDITGNSFIGFGNFAIIFGKDDDLQEESDLSMESGMTHRTIFSVGRCIGDSDLSKSGEAKWTT